MNTLKILDLLKKERGLPSDYAASKLLKIRPSTISKWRHHGGTMDDKTAVKMADLLGLDPAVIGIWMEAERTKCPPMREALQRAAQRLAGTFGAMVIAFTLVFSATYSAPAPAYESPTMYIMLNNEIPYISPYQTGRLSPLAAVNPAGID